MMGTEASNSELLHILLLEDSENDAELLIDLLLSAGFNLNIDRADNENEFVLLLNTKKHEIILIDFTLPGFDGFQALVLAEKYCPDTPVICVSGTIGEETAVELLKCGAVDYLLKDRINRLPFAIKNALNKAEYKRQQKIINDKLLESEKQLRSFYNQAVTGFYRLTPDRKMIMANKKLAEILGYNSVEHLLKSRQEGEEISNKYPRDEFLRLLDEKGEIKDYVTNWVTCDGKSIIVHENAKIIRDDNNNIIFYDGVVTDISDQKKVEAELAESKELFRTLAQVSPIGIFKTRADGYTIFVNKKWTEIAGISLSESLGFGWLNAVHPEDREQVERKWRENISNTSSSYAEYRFLRNDGSIVWVIGNAVPEFFEDKLNGYIGTITDVTELKQYEQMLRTLSMSVDQSPVSIILTDIKANIQYVNAKFEQVTGYKASEIIGQNPRILKSGSTAKDEYDTLWATLLAGKTWKGELLNKKKDGTLFWESATISPLTNNIGATTNYLAVKEDITERKQLLNQMFENEAQLNLITTSTLSVLYRLKYANMQYEYMNPVIEQLIGYSPEEINHIGFSSIVLKVEGVKGTELQRSELQKNRSRLYQEFRADYLIKTKSGEERWLTDTSFPWYDSFGNLLGSMGILTDITSRKIAEHELITAKEKAEEMNRLKTNLLANMSHELRTPLISILGYSELISLENTTANIREMADYINVGGNRLLATLNNLLQFSVITSQEIVPKYTLIDINEVLEEILNDYTNEITAKGLTLKKKYEKKAPLACLDRIFFREIMIRIINNAVKFTQKGNVTVETGLDDKNFIVRVSDTGVGIPSGNQKLIFQEFRQSSEGLNRSYEGTGLGLTIAEKYTKAMNGEITVNSEAGKGSCFTITFPLANKPADYYEERHKSSQIIQPKQPRILYVENDFLSVRVVRMFLRDKFWVEHANNGEDALRMAANDDFDLILMDINLDSNMNGIEVTGKIRNMEKYKFTPIIAVTAYAMHDDEREFIDSGCSHYIAKPFRKNSLIQLIEQALGKD